MARAENFSVEWDEDGLSIWFDDDEGENHSFVVTDPAQLHAAVNAAVGPWLAEMEAASREFLPLDKDAYDLNDPKHPHHHEVFADIATKGDDQT